MDYGVNIFQRYREEKSKDIVLIIRQTGGAVALEQLHDLRGLLLPSHRRKPGFRELRTARRGGRDFLRDRGDRRATGIPTDTFPK